MNVIALELDIAWETKPANFDKVRRLLAQASPEKDALVILPEKFATGFSKNVSAIGEQYGGETEQFLARVAREFSISLTAGAAMQGIVHRSASPKSGLLCGPHPGQSAVMTDDRPASGVTSQPRVFATTHWSVVLAAGEADTPQSSAALEKLCRAYWYPLYAHIRRRGYSEEEAQDLTQELFQRLLERQFLCGLLREGGRFRSFLLTALGHFLAEHWQRSQAQKRGGGQPIVSIDAQTAEERYRLEPRDERTPETIYEYRWAMELLDQVLGRLQQEFSEADKDELFDQLRTYLVEGAAEMSYAEGARRLGMSEAALRKAVERLRLRYQELFRQEIAHTVTSPAEVEDELRHLQTVMRG